MTGSRCQSKNHIKIPKLLLLLDSFVQASHVEKIPCRIEHLEPTSFVFNNIRYQSIVVTLQLILKLISRANPDLS